MTNTKDSFGEDVSLLYPDSHSERFQRFAESHLETPIIKGVVNQLRKWPTDLFLAFVAACLIIGSLVFLVFVTVIICLPTVVCYREEDISMLELGASPNVYFLKLDKQNWSATDLCYIETAAYRHPDLNIYLINLMKEEPVAGSLNRSIDDSTLEYKRNRSNNHDTSLLSPEDRLRETLARANANVKNIDVSIDRFFKGSKLSKIIRDLNDELLEIAAKAQLLWSVPGIALKPSMFCNLDSIKHFLCKDKDECLPDKLATIELDNDIQVTGVPCQAFVGFLVQEISRNDHNGKYTLREAVKRYCPRSHYCPEVRILNTIPKCPTDALNCPIVYSSILMHDYLNLENLIM